MLGPLSGFPVPPFVWSLYASDLDSALGVFFPSDTCEETTLRSITTLSRLARALFEGPPSQDPVSSFHFVYLGLDKIRLNWGSSSRSPQLSSFWDD